MARLLLKIFLAYWLAASVVIVISDFEPHRHIHNPELTDALDSALALNGRAVAAGYESGACADTLRRLNTARESLALAAPGGRLLCGDPGVDARNVIAAALKSRKRTTANYAMFQLIAVPINGPGGAPYVLLLRNSYSTALQYYGLLPGYTTIAISCVVTFFLAVLLAWPIRRLRTAAGQIAMGRLDARVRWGMRSSRKHYATSGDDIDQLVRDFNHMAERLEHLANAQRLLLRDVSHELRSPLTRLGVALSLARGDSPREMRPHLDRIESEAARLNGLIGHILSLSHMDSLGQVELPAVVSLRELIEDLLPDVEYEAAQRGCAIETAFGEECLVRADPDLLRAAAENIVRNAIKYAPGSGAIQVTTSVNYGAGGEVAVLAVADRGPGIPDEELNQVLKPFYRTDGARRRQHDGSGIGLAIADRAARLHGGAISLRNRQDGGLMVELRLPVAPAV